MMNTNTLIAFKTSVDERESFCQQVRERAQAAGREMTVSQAIREALRKSGYVLAEPRLGRPAKQGTGRV